MDKIQKDISVVLYFSILSVILTYPLFWNLDSTLIIPDPSLNDLPTLYGNDAAFTVFMIYWFKNSLETGKNPLHIDLFSHPRE